MLNRLCIIGVGLIGGSLARALKRAGACSEVVGAGRNEAHLRRALELGVIDRMQTRIAAAVEEADLVVVAVPLGAFEAVFATMAGALAPHTIVTDVGSAKASVVQAAQRAFGRVPPRLVPGHPIAGTERSGVESSCAELFEGHRVILTPLPDTEPQALAQVRAMWELTGAEVVEMDVRRHDAVLAATSHLPHLLAYALVDNLARAEDDGAELFQYAAGGFRDFTRIASSDPLMWRDICLANREALLLALARFTGDLQSLAAAVHAGDGARLLEIFQHAKAARDEFIQGVSA